MGHAGRIVRDSRRCGVRGVQLRQEAKARKLQALMSVLADIRPPEVVKAWHVMSSLPVGFDVRELTDDELFAVRLVSSSYSRLGTLLAVGAVEERDIFPHITFSRGAIEAWEKIKHVSRTDEVGLVGRVVPSTILQEQLAARAQAYLLREGVERFGSAPFFNADWDALDAMGERVKQARVTAS